MYTLDKKSWNSRWKYKGLGGKEKKSWEECVCFKKRQWHWYFFKFVYLIMVTPENNLCSMCSLAVRITEAYSSASFCEKYNKKKGEKWEHLSWIFSQKCIPSINFLFNFKLYGQLWHQQLSHSLYRGASLLSCFFFHWDKSYIESFEKDRV